MGFPSGYKRGFGFQNFQDVHPTTPLPGDQVDAELDGVGASTAAIAAFLKGVMRSDGKLANFSVGVDQLAPDLSIGFKSPSVWVPDTPYLADDTVFQANKFWKCIIAHTAGGAFQARYWQLLVDFGAALGGEHRPEAYGAAGDLINFNDASISLSTPHTLTTNTTAIPQFVGPKLVAVIGADSTKYTLLTTALWVDAHTLTLAAAATTAVTNADCGLATDDTVALQATIDAAGDGGTVELTARYGISATLNGRAGQIMRGQGQADVPLTTTEVVGTTIQMFSLADVPALSFSGSDDNHQKPGWVLRDFALLRYREAAGTLATGVYAQYARTCEISNLYVSGFGTGVKCGAQVWKHWLHRLTICEANIGIWLDSSSEDGVISSTNISLFRTGGVGIKMNNQCQTETLLNVQIKACLYGVLISQGDTNGDGTGTPLPMHLNAKTCQFEDCISAGIYVISASQAATQRLYPRITYDTCRAFASGTFATANSGQTAIYAQHAAAIVVTNPQHDSLSYGYVLGKSFGVSTFSGTDCGPTLLLADTCTYGTSRVSAGAGSSANVTGIPS